MTVFYDASLVIAVKWFSAVLNYIFFSACLLLGHMLSENDGVDSDWTSTLTS